LAGDGLGLVGTSGRGGAVAPPEAELHSFDEAFPQGMLHDTGMVSVPNLATASTVALVVSASRILWAETAMPGEFRVVACTRPLSSCTQPFEVVKPRAGSVIAIAATDSDVFTAFSGGPENHLVRTSLGSMAETSLADSTESVGAVTLSSNFVYWAEGSQVRRCALAAPCSPQTIQTIGYTPSSGPPTYLAADASERNLYLLAPGGVYRIVLS
jgi:hypothetical protein